VLSGVVFVFLLPSSQEKLQTRYEKFMAQGGEDSKALAQLFLDSIAYKDETTFHKLSIIKTMPAYKSGEVMNVGEKDEEIPQGTLGKLVTELEAEIAVLEQRISEKTQDLDAHSSENLSATLLEQRIKQTKSKIANLTTEYDEKEAELSKKLRRLRKELAETENELAEQRRIRENILMQPIKSAKPSTRIVFPN
jgi:predicted RNase H-like nuclease (RuvC/YqgF family)